MRLTRRQALAALAAPAISSTTRAFGQSALPEIEKGPFDGTLEGLKAYQIPEWFKDAKFGIWAHWGRSRRPRMGTGTRVESTLKARTSTKATWNDSAILPRSATKTFAECGLPTSSTPVI